MSKVIESIQNFQKIEVGDLVFLGSDIESGPIGIVLNEIIVCERDQLVRDIDKRLPPNERTAFTRREYKCCMIGKNGKVINMVFSEHDLIVISKGVKLINDVR
jgi:hypothetical protein|tara:strand:+ start:217 stop:525 length:309 start_codon:yes stop_codon:yes gene_type:complete